MNKRNTTKIAYFTEKIDNLCTEYSHTYTEFIAKFGN